MVVTAEGMALTPEHVVDWAVNTGLVYFDEVSVAKLKDGAFLLNLPEGLVPQTFIQATAPVL